MVLSCISWKNCSIYMSSMNDKSESKHQVPINLGFWKTLHNRTVGEGRPIFVLAPMADVTDEPFRLMIARLGKPDVMWTEFVSADGLIRATEEGKKKLMKDLLYSEAERPIVAQLFGSRPEYMEQAAKLCADLGFDGIDINMGCPDKTIEKQGAGAAMIKNPELAKEIILAAKRGARRKALPHDLRQGKVNKTFDNLGEEFELPVSVKTRIGYNKDELKTWLPKLLEARPAVITIHARTRKEMSLVPARWEKVQEAVEIRNEIQKGEDDKTLIFGNGDVESIKDGALRANQTGADGVMLGRAIFGNPWLFDAIKQPDFTPYIPELTEKMQTMIEHTQLFEEILGGTKSFAIMKKHYKAYVNDFDGAKELRTKLMEAENASQVEKITREFILGIEN